MPLYAALRGDFNSGVAGGWKVMKIKIKDNKQ
jgi:hypothetical protein